MSSSKTRRKNNRAFAKDFFNDLEEELGDVQDQRIKEYERPPYGITEQALNETQDEEEDYGDEDFEDYSDDFDEFGDLESDEVDLSSAVPEGRHEPCLNTSDIVEPITREQLEQVPSSPVGKCFEEPQARHDGLWLPETKQMRKRAKEILREVHLSEESWELLNLPSLSAYSLRARTVCGHLFQDSGSQYNEDWIETQTQTESVDEFDKCVQCPDDLRPLSACYDSIRLQQFVQSASLLCESLILKRNSNFDFDRWHRAADGAVEMSFDELLKGRDVLSIACSDGNVQHVLVVYDKRESDAISLLVVWDVQNCRQPYKVLACTGSARCCSWSPMRSHMVFAGLAEGSIALWDLRESASMHTSMVLQNNVAEAGGRHETIPIRSETFSTDDFLHGNHHSACVDVVALQPSSHGSTSLVDRTSCVQLASLDDFGCIRLWTVVEISQPDQGSCSETDLGLSIGGRIKLLLSALVRPESVSGLARSMAFWHDDSNEVLVAQGSRCVQRLKRFGETAYPSAYYQPQHAAGVTTAIACSPFVYGLFLVSYESGAVGLFSIKVSEPLLHWSNACSSAALHIDWMSPSRFCILDADSYLYVWDLARDLVTHQFCRRIPDLDASCASISTSGSNPFLAFSPSPGCVRVHNIYDEVDTAHLSCKQEMNSIERLLR